jgi:hypothetical protein
LFVLGHRVQNRPHLLEPASSTFRILADTNIVLFYLFNSEPVGRCNVYHDSLSCSREESQLRISRYLMKMNILVSWPLSRACFFIFFTTWFFPCPYGRGSVPHPNSPTVFIGLERPAVMSDQWRWDGIHRPGAGMGEVRARMVHDDPIVHHRHVDGLLRWSRDGLTRW